MRDPLSLRLSTIWKLVMYLSMELDNCQTKHKSHHYNCNTASYSKPMSRQWGSLPFPGRSFPEWSLWADSRPKPPSARLWGPELCGDGIISHGNQSDDKSASEIRQTHPTLFDDMCLWLVVCLSNHVQIKFNLHLLVPNVTQNVDVTFNPLQSPLNVWVGWSSQKTPRQTLTKHQL